MRLHLTALAFALTACASQPWSSPPRPAKKLEGYPNTFLLEPQTPNSNSSRLIVYFHGSDGPTKFSLANATEIAQAGFRVLHLCWYNCERAYLDDLAPLKRIDLITIANQIKDITTQLKAQPKSIYYVGVSRGAELASLLASHQDELGLRIDGTALVAGISATAVSRNSRPRAAQLLQDNFDSSDPSWRLGERVIPNRTLIDLARFKGPLMIAHGEDDKIWTVKNAYRMRDRYQLAGRRAKMLIFPDEGHQFTPQARERLYAEIQSFCKVR